MLMRQQREPILRSFGVKSTRDLFVLWAISRGSKPLSSDPLGAVAGGCQKAGDVLCEGGRAANVTRGRQRRRPTDGRKKRGIDAAGWPWPVRRGRPCVDVRDVDAVVLRRQILQFVPVPDAGRVPDRVQQSKRSRTAEPLSRSEHRHERHDSGSSGDELDRLRLVVTPYEPSTNRSAPLHPIADHEILREVRRNLAVRKTLDRELYTPVRAWL